MAGASDTSWVVSAGSGCEAAVAGKARNLLCIPETCREVGPQQRSRGCLGTVRTEAQVPPSQTIITATQRAFSLVQHTCFLCVISVHLHNRWQEDSPLLMLETRNWSPERLDHLLRSHSRYLGSQD